jgi:hypothetical protein
MNDNRAKHFDGGGSMSVNWDRDIDAALAKAKTEKRPLLLDFSAAPG